MRIIYRKIVLRYLIYIQQGYYKLYDRSRCRGFETQRRCHQKSKTGGISGPTKRTYVLQFFFKKRETTHCKTLDHMCAKHWWTTKYFLCGQWSAPEEITRQYLFPHHMQPTYSYIYNRSNVNLKQCWDTLLLFISCTQVTSVFSCVQFHTTWQHQRNSRRIHLFLSICLQNWKKEKFTHEYP